MKIIQSVFAKLTPLKILKSMVCMSASLYLTAYVDLYTLDSIWSRLFLFCCFFAASEFLSRVVSRFCEFLSLKTVLSAVIVSVLILVVCHDIFIPSVREIFVSLVSETAGEICLCDVVANGKNIPVAQVKVVENAGWLYREEYDNFVIWPEDDGIKNCLKLRFFAKEVHLGFPSTPYAGKVTITSSTGSSETLELRCSERAEGEPVEYADCSIDCRYVYTPLEILLYSMGALSIIIPFCLILSGFGLQQLLFGVMLVTHYLLFVICPQIAPDKFTNILLVLLVAVSYLCLSSGLSHCLLEKYRTRGKIALAVVIAFYASLASFGQRFFLDGNTRMHLSVEGILYILLGVVWFIPIIYMLLFGLELLASSVSSGIRPTHHKQAFWTLLAILCFCQMVILWNFWPGGFPADSIDLLYQAAGFGNITNWHPALNAICFRMILTICPMRVLLLPCSCFFSRCFVRNF